MFNNPHLREHAWEVVDHKVVHPVALYNHSEDLEITRLDPHEVIAHYTFDMKPGSPFQPRKVLSFARKELLKQISRSGYNVLLLEGWKATMLQRNSSRRIQVEYRARPAYSPEATAISKSRPPFMEVLDI